MVGEAEVVVAGKIEQTLAVAADVRLPTMADGAPLAQQVVGHAPFERRVHARAQIDSSLLAVVVHDPFGARFPPLRALSR